MTEDALRTLLGPVSKREMSAFNRALKELTWSVEFSSSRRYDHLRDVVLSRVQARALLRAIEALGCAERCWISSGSACSNRRSS
ncbi:MAG TPA: hypothetical protein VK741_25715 [Acetobacteraceae bacterium]|jgi:hypothetical protein|nr:hypothetical protein [Acetobacteraceae bacterium]